MSAEAPRQYDFTGGIAGTLFPKEMAHHFTIEERDRVAQLLFRQPSFTGSSPFAAGRDTQQRRTNADE